MIYISMYYTFLLIVYVLHYVPATFYKVQQCKALRTFCNVCKHQGDYETSSLYSCDDVTVGRWQLSPCSRNLSVITRLKMSQCHGYDLICCNCGNNIPPFRRKIFRLDSYTSNWQRWNCVEAVVVKTFKGIWALVEIAFSDEYIRNMLCQNCTTIEIADFICSNHSFRFCWSAF